MMSNRLGLNIVEKSAQGRCRAELLDAVFNLVRGGRCSLTPEKFGNQRHTIHDVADLEHIVAGDATNTANGSIRAERCAERQELAQADPTRRWFGGRIEAGAKRHIAGAIGQGSLSQAQVVVAGSADDAVRGQESAGIPDAAIIAAQVDTGGTGGDTQYHVIIDDELSTVVPAQLVQGAATPQLFCHRADFVPVLHQPNARLKGCPHL